MKRTVGIALAAILTLTALSGCQSAARSDSTSTNPSASPATALPAEGITHAGAGELRVGTLSFQLISSETSDGVRVGDSAAYVLCNVPGATRTHPEAAEIGPLAFFLDIVEQPSFDENSPPGTIAVPRATIAVIAASGDVIEQIYAPEDLSGP